MIRTGRGQFASVGWRTDEGKRRKDASQRGYGTTCYPGAAASDHLGTGDCTWGVGVYESNIQHCTSAVFHGSWDVNVPYSLHCTEYWQIDWWAQGVHARPPGRAPLRVTRPR